MMLNNGRSDRPFFSSSLAYIGLIVCGLMWVLPFLNYYHAYPLTTFYQEWGAAALGLAAALCLLLAKQYWQNPEVPRIILLPVALLLILVVQYWLGQVPYFGQMLLIALYLMWAALMLMVGLRLRDVLGLPVLAAVLASFLLLGAELSALVGVLQEYGWHTFLDRVVTAKTSPAVYGNIAQPNLFAEYLSYGLASLGLLYARGTLRPWLAALFATPLLFVMTLSGSRSAWLFLLAMAALSYLWQRRDRGYRSLFVYSGLLLLGFVLMQGVVQLPGVVDSASSVTTIQRLFGDVHSGGIRLYLWHEAWLIFLQHPILGAGFGQFAWQHFLLSSSLHDTLISGLYNNAHNLVMQLAAETGLAGVLVLFIAVLPWLRQARRADLSIYHWWGYAILLIMGVHNLLEYPLWYANFIGIAALLLGMFDTRRYRLELKNAGRVCLLLTLVLGALSLKQLLVGYRTLEEATGPRPPGLQDAVYSDHVRRALMALQQEPLWRSYAELYITQMFGTSFDRLDDRLESNQQVMRFIPIANGVYRQALYLAQSGDIEAACLQEERAIWAYPADFPRANAELSELARKDPARYAALLEFSLQKYKEYQSAVPAK